MDEKILQRARKFDMALWFSWCWVVLSVIGLIASITYAVHRIRRYNANDAAVINIVSHNPFVVKYADNGTIILEQPTEAGSGWTMYVAGGGGGSMVGSIAIGYAASASANGIAIGQSATGETR